MPKGRKSNKTKTNKAATNQYGSDDESVMDTWSVISNASSDARSVSEEGVEEIDEEELLEEKLKEAIDGAFLKSAQARITNLDYLCNTFTLHYLPDFVVDRYMTLTEVIHRSLKKGKMEEQNRAAQLAPLLCIQLGAGHESEEIYKDLRPVMLQLLTDNATCSSVRAKCAMSVSLLTFLASEEVSDVWNTLNVLEKIWKTCGKNEIIGDTVSAWSLMLTLLSSHDVYKYNAAHIGHLSKLLDSDDVTVRISAGECIALIYERCRDYDEDFVDDLSEDLCAMLQELATDSHKYRAKKDRKQQRSCFRDVLRTVEDGYFSTDLVKFGREVLQINSWCRKLQYNSFCEVLRSGMNLHLTENYLLREVFDLGPALPAIKTQHNKASKLERHLLNVAAFKERTLIRGKFRDKRTAVF